MPSRSIRAVLTAKRRVGGVALLAGVALLVLGEILTVTIAKELFWVGLAGVGVAFVASAFSFYGLKCPRCRGNLGPTVGVGFFAIPKRLRYCPYCSVDLDAPVQ